MFIVLVTRLVLLIHDCPHKGRFWRMNALFYLVSVYFGLTVLNGTYGGGHVDFWLHSQHVLKCYAFHCKIHYDRRSVKLFISSNTFFPGEVVRTNRIADGYLLIHLIRPLLVQ